MMKQLVSTGLAAAAALTVFAIANPARAEFCTGLANGKWCDGSILKTCIGGTTSGSQPCSCGCQPMPVGTDDQCKACGNDFCSSLGNGLYCDGNVLKNCSGGTTVGTQNCQCGCDVMPPGTPDQCATCGGGDFCSGKANGKWCDGSNLKTCSGGATSNSQSCQCGCDVMPAGTDDQCATCGGGDFCSGKANGAWCDGNTLKNCSGGVTAGSQNCPCTCQVMPAGTPDQCQTCSSDFCTGKQDGAWCNSGSLVQCASGTTASSTPCPNGCQVMQVGVPDQCAPSGGGFCSDKSDGSHCDGTNLVECSGGVQVSVKTCSAGCQIIAGNLPDVCASSGGDYDFCWDKADGLWCNGDMLVECGGHKQTSGLNCANGCQGMPAGQDDACILASPEVPPGQGITVSADANGCAVFSGSINIYENKGLPIYDQTKYTDKLGTCSDATIESDGCLITSFSMLYSYLGLSRSINGQIGANPPIENAWRNQNGGYDNGCWAVWGVNPPGLTLQWHTNPSTCISFGSGKDIATSLNSGMPVIAGVHWDDPTCEGYCLNFHWVLVVGADSNGLIINDPWKGKENARFTVHNPPYILDDYHTPILSGIGSGEGPGGAVNEYGEPLGKGQSAAARPRTPEPLEKAPTATTMCAFGSTGSAASSLVLLAGLGLLASRRSRKQARG